MTNKYSRRITDEERDKMVELRKGGATIDELAMIFNAAKVTIINNLRKGGIDKGFCKLHLRGGSAPSSLPTPDELIALFGDDDRVIDINEIFGIEIPKYSRQYHSDLIKGMILEYDLPIVRAGHVGKFVLAPTKPKRSWEKEMEELSHLKGLPPYGTRYKTTIGTKKAKAILIADYYGFTAREIANLLDVSVATVYVVLKGEHVLQKIGEVSTHCEEGDTDACALLAEFGIE